MESQMINAAKPQYSEIGECWSYDELKSYFDEIVDCPFHIAACTFLSNVEGLGDYFDKHPFFDFQAYLIIAVFGINEGFVYSPVTDEFNRLKADIEYFLSGKIDSWAMDKANLTAMKNDCKKVWDVYFKEN